MVQVLLAKDQKSYEESTELPLYSVVSISKPAIVVAGANGAGSRPRKRSLMIPCRRGD